MKRYLSLVALLAGLVLASVGLLLFLNLATPSSAGPLGILLVFILIYIISFSLLMLLIRLLMVIYRAIRPRKETVVGKEKSRINKKRFTLIAAVLSLVPIFLISLNSIGQLNFVDMVLIIAIEAVAIFYIMRRV